MIWKLNEIGSTTQDDESSQTHNRKNIFNLAYLVLWLRNKDIKFSYSISKVKQKEGTCFVAFVLVGVVFSYMASWWHFVNIGASGSLWSWLVICFISLWFHNEVASFSSRGRETFHHGSHPTSPCNQNIWVHFTPVLAGPLSLLSQLMCRIIANIRSLLMLCSRLSLWSDVLRAARIKCLA